MLIRIFLLLLLIFIPNSGTALRDTYPGDDLDGKTYRNALRKKIDALLSNPLFSSASIGIRIVSLPDGISLYSLNQDKLYHPASNQKLMTTSAALHLLGNDFNFRTSFGIDGKVVDGVLNGNLLITGGGDPLITTSDLDSVASLMLQQGIRRINGNIIGDITYFDTLYWGKGWMWDDEPYPESPFISPLAVNNNSIIIKVQPGRRENDTLVWMKETETKYVTIVNKGYTTSDTNLPRVSLTRPSQSRVFSIDGVMAPADTAADISASIWRPELYFLYLLEERLKSDNIECSGSVLFDEREASSIIAVLKHPLDSVLHLMNKESNNLAAENLLKTIDAELSGRPGTSAGGIEAIKRHLHTYGIDTASLSIADGSGASWYNATSPRAITEILVNEYRQKTTFPRFYESLSIAGRDGTLRKRMRKPYLEDKVHAKSGSLSRVNCISGYVTLKNGGMAAFSIMVNHFTCKNADVRQLQDDIISAIASYSMK